MLFLYVFELESRCPEIPADARQARAGGKEASDVHHVLEAELAAHLAWVFRVQGLRGWDFSFRVEASGASFGLWAFGIWIASEAGWNSLEKS